MSDASLWDDRKKHLDMEDKELIIHWFEHIAQIADDRKTATGVEMSMQDALDEIKALAKDAAYYVRNHIN